MDKTMTIHVVPHTHWDREWYRPFEGFRYRLVKMMDLLLECMEGQEIEFFVLDGHTLMVDDYLEIRPENRERITRLIGQGRLIIGPWYTQPNTNMSSAEAQIRNLLKGKAEMEKYGGGMGDINYLPDQFGFHGQIPQIMKGFGMTHLVGWRGLPKGCPDYFLWEGSDGTVVRVCSLWKSYGNASGLSGRTERKALNVLGKNFELPSLNEKMDGILSMQDRAVSPNLLAMNGMDHTFPNAAMGKTMEKMEQLHPECCVVQSHFKKYIEAVEASATKELVSYRGEHRDPREGVILPASQSMRMDVKGCNRRMEDMLERYIEPRMSLMMALGETRLPLALLQKAWDYLLENQAHDSLCCSNADESYREIMVRFEKTRRIAREILGELEQRLLRHIDGLARDAVAVFNPSFTTRNEPLSVEVIMDRDTDDGQPRLFDGKAEIPSYVQSVREDACIRYIPFSGQLVHLPVRIFTMTVHPGALAPAGYKALAIGSGAPRPRPDDGLVRGPREMENEFLRVRVNGDATLDIEDKGSGRTYRNVHYFIDEGEAGNGFEHFPPVNDMTAVSSGRDMGVGILENNPLRGILRVTQRLRVPAGLTPDRTSRSAETADLSIDTRILLRNGCPYVEFETRIDNTAADHRLRVAFPTDIASDTGYAGQPFDVVLRPVRPETAWEPGDREPWAGYHPMHDFCGITDGAAGAALAADEIMEYEILPCRNALCFTLIRATDRLYVDLFTGSLAQRDGDIDLSRAQLPGSLQFRYAFIPHGGGYENAMEAVERFRHPLSWARKDLLEEETLPGYMPPPADLKPAGGFIAVDGQCVVTALKPARDQNGIILRLYNPLACRTDAVVRADARFDILSARRVRLDETDLGDAPTGSNGVQLSAGPRQIVSLRLFIQLRGEESS